jgi:hypothetical protein
MTITRRELLRNALAAAAVLGMPAPLLGCTGTPPPGPENPDEARLREWVRTVRDSSAASGEVPLGRTVAAVGLQAVGARAPYVASTLEEYIKAGGDPARAEPLTLSLSRFDCVTLVESCLAIGRVARRDAPPTWEAFGHEVERMRYRGGKRVGYLSRLHYFSEWIHDNAARGLVQPLGQELGGVPDRRPLRFMSEHRDSYPALANPALFAELRGMERRLDGSTRWVIPTEKIPAASDRIQTGDVLAFATSIPGLDVTHTAFAFRDEAGVLRVLHAPLSGGVVAVTDSTLPEYVAAIRRATGILVARPRMG